MRNCRTSYDVSVDESWEQVLGPEFRAPYYSRLQELVSQERSQCEIFPPAHEVFTALQLTSFHNTKVVILGQDPYHGPQQAHGLSFSVQAGVKIPPSLRNIFVELHDDLGIAPPSHGDLTAWANQGVLLLNTTLTVRKGEAGSHQGYGWETFTDAVITALNMRNECCVFVLWGAPARKKKTLITSPQHHVIESAHPSPFSARAGFFGSKPFSQVNRALQSAGHDPINWSLL